MEPIESMEPRSSMEPMEDIESMHTMEAMEAMEFNKIQRLLGIYWFSVEFKEFHGFHGVYRFHGYPASDLRLRVSVFWLQVPIHTCVMSNAQHL